MVSLFINLSLNSCLDFNIQFFFAKGFLEMDEIMATDEALKEDASGTTAVIVLVKNGQLYCVC